MPSLPTVLLCALTELLVAIALAKGGYEFWAVGGMLFLYGLHLAAQCLKPGTRRPIDQVKI